MEDPRRWIAGDETAGAMLARVPIVRPFHLLPPLHRAPLRAGDVVEITGPSPSAKSELLLQAVINCILPREWNGVHFGGLERTVLYFDLDCRFDVLRLSHVLKHRIMTHGSAHASSMGSKEDLHMYDATTSQISDNTKDELFFICMRRFLYVRCYSSLEFLAAIKTTRRCAHTEFEALGGGIQFLMIDSIGAFYWIDRASQPLPHGDDKRRTLSLQNVVESIVEEIRNLLQGQPALVLATKAAIFGSRTSTSSARRSFEKRYADDTTDLSNLEDQKLLYQEYMPSIWQSFVTHRIHLRVSDRFTADNKFCTFPVYTSEWVQPPLNVLDEFTVRDDGIFMIS